MKYEPSLDGLRAVAIAAVFVYHFSFSALPGGWAGVDIFFVLSGYLITTILANEIDSTGRVDLKQFYFNRFLRLAPAFACLLAFMALRAVTTADGAHRQSILESIGITAVYMMNWNRAFSWFGQDILGHTWSLSMEEQFYIVWPLLLLLIHRKHAIRWTMSLIVVITVWRVHLALSGADPERTYNGFDTHADPLFIGCTLALFKPGKRLARLAQRTAVLPVLGIAAILATVGLRTLAAQTIGLTLAALCTAWIITAALEDGWLKRTLSLRPLVYTGKISYGLYLWHYPIIRMIHAHVHLPSMLTLPLALLSYPVAAISFWYVEKRFLKLKARYRVPVVTVPSVAGVQP
ncbi:acyltransferase family protein [Paraburkholderia sp. GAS334]|uniref:acyltransferase family protein n=1 Tax=Paraburkholderia sp. GAS334 TaxID=3035131 RepID=UPI003D1F5635